MVRGIEGGPRPHDMYPDGTPEENKQTETEPTIERFKVESRHLTKETREQATESGIQTMREILGPFEDYAVFASTGIYLQNKEKGIAEDYRANGDTSEADGWDRLPGDFDAAVKNERDLNLIRERLANVPGIKFENDGDFKHFNGENTKVLSGIIPIRVEDVDGKTIEVEYEFEIFHDSRIVTDDVLAKRETVAGLQVLTLEGLNNQYMNNLAFEAGVEKSSTEVAQYLTDIQRESSIRRELEAWKNTPEAERDAFPASQELIDLTHQLRLGPDQLLAFYDEADKYRDMQGDVDADIETATSSMARILAGQKTKVGKRIQDLDRLGKIQRPSEYDNGNQKQAA